MRGQTRVIFVGWTYQHRAVARKKLQPRRTHGPLYEISHMKSFNIISLIKKKKNRQYLVKFYRGECLGSPHTGYGPATASRNHAQK